MTRFVAFTLVLMITVSAVSGCAVRNRHTIKRTTVSAKPDRVKKDRIVHIKPPAPTPRGEQVPTSYADAMEAVRQHKTTDEIEDALQKAYENLERKNGTEEAARITGQDPVFQNEVALVLSRKKDLDRAQESLEKAWQSLSQDVPVTAATSFNTALYRLNDRLYDAGTDMNPRRDQAIMRAFRDFVFLKKRSERYFVDQVMRRDHRFLPEPAIFPGYFGSIPIEVVNDWYHHSMKTDLLSWRRFAHLPVHYSDGHQRQMKQAIAANLLIIGVLKGDQKIVQQAVQRLEHTAPAGTGSFRYDRSSRGLLMFGHYILGQQEMAMRYEDTVLKNILVP